MASMAWSERDDVATTAMNDDGGGGGKKPPAAPVLPLLVQMNVRLKERDLDWRETTRWVKFQEDVEDGGKRWSKPFVPTFHMATVNQLRNTMRNRGLMALDLEARNIDEIVDELQSLSLGDVRGEKAGPDPPLLGEAQFAFLKQILNHRVKLRMKLDLIGRVSRGRSVSGGSRGASRKPSVSSLGVRGSVGSSRPDSKESLGESESPRALQGAAPGGDLGGGHDGPQASSSSPDSIKRSNSTSTPRGAQREKSIRLRSHNLFSKKVPKGAEACNVLVATGAPGEAEAEGNGRAPAQPTVIFVRLRHALFLEDFCEIAMRTRFLGIVLGPPECEDLLVAMGKALGMVMSDQTFPKLAYRAGSADDLFLGLDDFSERVTVLAPSAWDPLIRLDPPKSLPSQDQRVSPFKSQKSSSSFTFGNHNGSAKSPGRDLSKEMAGGGPPPGLDPPPYPASLDQAEAQAPPSPEDGGGGDDDDGRVLTLGADAAALNAKDDLVRTGRLFGGLLDDVRRKWPWLASDYTDALHVQTLASIIYIYLATITKAITFGGFLGDITEGQQGVLESFLGHALAGGVFCLLAGQPLTVLGCTGPVLIFETLLVEGCKNFSINYMTIRLWIGLWTCFFCMLIVAFDLSVIVKYFTRFTEESFAALIGIIFIVEALKKLYAMSSDYSVNLGFDPDERSVVQEGCLCEPPAFPPSDLLEHSDGLLGLLPPESDQSLADHKQNNVSIAQLWSQIPWDEVTVSNCKIFGGTLRGSSCSHVPDVFFFSVILFFGTYLLASWLKTFKQTPYLTARIRSLISDYAVIIAILTFVLIDNTCDLETPKLIVPTEFKPTRSDIRSWMIPLTRAEDPVYLYLVAVVPAILLTILLFMDQQITSVIVNRSEHKLKKGCGYHLDMLIVGLMIGVCSLLGLPWCVAATVLCLGHVDSLKMETETSAPGERPQFLGVREQRVTGIMVFVLTALSVKLAPILKFIPMPVLYGVLMYMGVASLKGMQFVDRVCLLFMPQKYQPDHIYLRHVPLTKVHLFTAIQILSLVLLWMIKSTMFALVFPLMVLALVGLRQVMDYVPSVFSQNDLFWLDNLMPDRRGSRDNKRKGKGKKKSNRAQNQRGRGSFFKWRGARSASSGEEGVAAGGRQEHDDEARHPVLGSCSPRDEPV